MELRKRTIILAINSLDLGGAERQLIRIANAIDEDEFNIHVVSFSEDNPLAQGLDASKVRFHAIHRKSDADFHCLRQLRRLFRTTDADLCHTFTLDTSIYALLARFPKKSPTVIVSERNSGYRLTPRHRLLKRASLKFSDHCIANSQAGRDFNAFTFDQPIEKYSVVYNAVDTQTFVPGNKATARTKLGLSTRGKVLGMVASFKPQKNHHMLLRTVRRLLESNPGLRIVLVGDSLRSGFGGSDRYKQKIHNMINEERLGDFITIAGRREDIAAIYPAFDVTVLTSFHEGTPNVVLESLACGIPVIATNVSDAKHIVQASGAGFLVEVDDDESFIQVVNRVLTDDPFRQSAYSLGPEYIKRNFSTEVLRARICEVYDACISRARMRAAT